MATELSMELSQLLISFWRLSGNADHSRLTFWYSMLQQKNWTWQSISLLSMRLRQADQVSIDFDVVSRYTLACFLWSLLDCGLNSVEIASKSGPGDCIVCVCVCAGVSRRPGQGVLGSRFLSFPEDERIVC